MSAQTTTGPLSSPNAGTHDMFSIKTQSENNVNQFKQTELPPGYGKQTRLTKKIFVVGTTYGDFEDFVVDDNGNVSCSRKELTLRYRPVPKADGSYYYEFKIKPYSKKYDLYDQAGNFLIDIFNKFINPQLKGSGKEIPENYLNAVKAAVIEQGKSSNCKSTVLAENMMSPLERYVGSRLLRFCDRIISALLLEAENVWSHVEKEARKSGGVLTGKITRKTGKATKSELDKAIDRYIKDSSREEYQEGVVNNKRVNVKTKEVRQFVSLFYITPGDILETKIWYVKSISGQKTDPSKEVNTDLTQILDYWSIFLAINDFFSRGNTEIYFPEVPFYVLDSVGIWDISKSKKPTFKPVSLSSIVGLRMPFLMGYNWQGNAIDGTSLGYVYTSVRIDKLIAQAKVAGMHAMEEAVLRIARDFFHFKDYSLPSLKHAHYSPHESVIEDEEQLGGNLPDEPIGPSSAFAQRFPPMGAANKVERKFKQSPEGEAYYNKYRDAYRGTATVQENF